ncbi:hypothetical protein AGDE_00332 [Angomonas deanei]|uniref:RNA uridylyltransferase n=1 Tax=Angomonas deanei TaxID=59799 RepID=A0A7G2C693_9TRYP|nr:hypothetical protein AGDE_00332 [Angomonas deanei]CAD2215256.1 hypothetical protein, conserved [Angomonas deanei]|eukprot:EPY43589.1 hypothetical protein AGDE_00332 [Angomonas deanei]
MRRQFIKDFMQHYRKHTSTPQDKLMVDDLQNRLYEISVRCVNKGQLERFGSHRSGFCQTKSDLDLSLTYRNFSPWLRGMQRVDEQDHKRMARLSREATTAGMLNVRYLRALIPVVQFVDPISEIQCDITIGNLGGVENSKILEHVHHLFPDFFGAYIHLVKTWGKAKEVVSPEKCTFNSFTITTMALMVLQELGLLPVFHTTTGDLGQLTEGDVLAALGPFRLPPIYNDIGASGDDERIGEAVLFCFQKFAEYYAKFDFKGGTVSLIHPRRHRDLYRSTADSYMERYTQRKRSEWERYLRENPKEGPMEKGDFDHAVHGEAIQRFSNTFFVVEDCVNYVNCGRRVTLAPRAKHIMNEIQQLKVALQSDAPSFTELSTPTNKLSVIIAALPAYPTQE